MENHLTEKELNSTSNISNIRVKELLEYVNSVSTEFADTLSDDVLENLGNIKSEKFSINVRFSLSAPVEETITKTETVENIAPVNPDVVKDEHDSIETEKKQPQTPDKPVRPQRRTEMKSISRSIKRSYGALST